jgi:hypothetical protein
MQQLQKPLVLQQLKLLNLKALSDITRSSQAQQLVSGCLSVQLI